jgi:hypothetical protein
VFCKKKRFAALFWPNNVSRVRYPAANRSNGRQEAVVDFVWITVRGVSNGHGFHLVHFCPTFVPIAYDFAECGANLHHMRRFRHFMLESGAFLPYIPNPPCPIDRQLHDSAIHNDQRLLRSVSRQRFVLTDITDVIGAQTPAQVNFALSSSQI